MKISFIESGKPVAPIREKIVLEAEKHKNPEDTKIYCPHCFDGYVYNGIDVREIEISATSRAKAVLKWLDYLNANLRINENRVSDEYELLQDSYEECLGDDGTEEESIKDAIDGVFDNDTLWLEEKKEVKIFI